MSEARFYKDTIFNSIAERANKVVPIWSIAFLLENDPFIVAGGCFTGGDVNDIDIYPVKCEKFSRIDIERRLESIGAECIYESKNAVSIRLKDGTKLQFCDYYKKDVFELVNSFDFWHTQCGIQYEPNDDDEGGIADPSIKDIAYSDGWFKFKLTGETHYTGSEFPMSSMIRLGKYIKRDMFHGRSYIPDVFSIIKDIVKRGYRDYDDFKKQLQAVDLLELDPEEGGAAWDLFRTLFNRGLVDSKVDPVEIAKDESNFKMDEDFYHLIKKE